MFYCVSSLTFSYNYLTETKSFNTWETCVWRRESQLKDLLTNDLKSLNQDGGYYLPASNDSLLSCDIKVKAPEPALLGE